MIFTFVNYRKLLDICQGIFVGNSNFFLNGFLMLTRSASNWQNALSRFLFVFCGAMFPVAILPGWMQTIAYALPPTWSLEAIRLAAVESGAWTHPLYLRQMGFALGLMTLYALIAAYLQTVVEHRLRVTAELERI
jgi:ABC-2 type transport system permease protein